MCVIAISVLFVGVRYIRAWNLFSAAHPRSLEISYLYKSCPPNQEKCPSIVAQLVCFRALSFLFAKKLQCFIAWGSLWCPGIGSSDRSSWICGRFLNEPIPKPLEIRWLVVYGVYANLPSRSILFLEGVLVSPHAPSCMFRSSEHERYIVHHN